MMSAAQQQEHWPRASTAARAAATRNGMQRSEPLVAIYALHIDIMNSLDAITAS